MKLGGGDEGVIAIGLEPDCEREASLDIAVFSRELVGEVGNDELLIDEPQAVHGQRGEQDRCGDPVQ